MAVTTPAPNKIAKAIAPLTLINPSPNKINTVLLFNHISPARWVAVSLDLISVPKRWMKTPEAGEVRYGNASG